MATQQCVLWSTQGQWFLSCSESWESTERSAGTTMLLEIWWGAPPVYACLNNQEKNKAESHLQITCSCVWRGVYFSSKGSIILDPDFDIFQEMGHLCQMCKAIGANRQLVKPGGAQCLPSGNILASRIMIFLKTQYLILHSVCIWYIHIHQCTVFSVYFFLF